MLTTDTLLASGAPPIVAILRGLVPQEALSIAGALVDAGILMIEVPLNSPKAFTSIAMIQEAYGSSALIGAGTVLTTDHVDELAQTGAKLMVTPNTDAGVIGRACAIGLEAMPGFQTPSEAFVALAAGAKRLKLFPAGALGTGYFKAIRAVLPSDVGVWAVGNIDDANVAEWLAAGVEGLGIGGSLFRPGDSVAQVADAAAKLLRAIGHSVD